MAATGSPAFTQLPKKAYAPIPSSITANTKSDGTGTIGTDSVVAKRADGTTVWTAGANGSFLRSIIWTPVGTTANTATTATVGRAYRSTKSSGATTGGTDTLLLRETTLGAQTADSLSAAASAVVVPVNEVLDPSDTLLVSIHAAPSANTSWQVTFDVSDF